MKKALALVVLIVTPSIIFAQGTVVIANQTGLVKEWPVPSDPLELAVAKGGGYVELIATTKGNPLLHPMRQTWPIRTALSSGCRPFSRLTPVTRLSLLLDFPSA
jgi:hypothetical protein